MKLFILSLLILSFNTQAMELLSVKKSGSSLNVLTVESVNKAWNGSTPACLKDGSKLLGVNAAYLKTFGKNGKLCSNSEAAQRIAKIKHGVSEVIVIRYAELPEETIKKLGKI
jgi:hypothetical protein